MHSVVRHFAVYKSSIIYCVLIAGICKAINVPELPPAERPQTSEFRALDTSIRGHCSIMAATGAATNTFSEFDSGKVASTNNSVLKRVPGIWYSL